jgi:hypothetical protein
VDYSATGTDNVQSASEKSAVRFIKKFKLKSQWGQCSTHHLVLGLGGLCDEFEEHCALSYAKSASAGL